MIKCEIEDDRVEIVFRGTAEEVFGELIEIMEKYADQFLHVPLGKFIEMLGETNKLVMAKKAADSENNASDEVRQDD
jgi:acylphosphatase